MLQLCKNTFPGPILRDGFIPKSFVEILPSFSLKVSTFLIKYLNLVLSGFQWQGECSVGSLPCRKIMCLPCRKIMCLPCRKIMCLPCCKIMQRNMHPHKLGKNYRSQRKEICPVIFCAFYDKNIKDKKNNGEFFFVRQRKSNLNKYFGPLAILSKT